MMGEVCDVGVCGVGGCVMWGGVGEFGKRAGRWLGWMGGRRVRGRASWIGVASSTEYWVPVLGSWGSGMEDVSCGRLDRQRVRAIDSLLRVGS